MAFLTVFFFFFGFKYIQNNISIEDIVKDVSVLTERLIYFQEFGYEVSLH